MNLTLFPLGRSMRIVFMGTPAAAVPSLERCMADGHEIAAVYTQPDRPSGRGNRIAFSPIKEFALEHGITVLQPTIVRTPEAALEFRSFEADVAVVVAYGRILPIEFFEAFRYGAINVHFSLLPKYRGAAPVNWAIASGEVETGVTTMRMDEGLDTGDILLRERMAIGADENSVELMTRLAVLGAELLSKTLKEIDRIVPVPQDHSNATLAPIFKKVDGLIDWSLPGKVIADRVRGFQPFPTSFTSFRGNRLTVWKASVIDDGSEKIRAEGVIADVASGSIVVTAGDGTRIAITELQPEGKRRMTAREFINGLQPRIGEVFGR